MTRRVYLVTDQIYLKTLRHLEKVKTCLTEQDRLFLARVRGFSEGLDAGILRDLNIGVQDGSVREIADAVLRSGEATPASTLVLALNQSAVLPAIALGRLLDLPVRSGYVESCNKYLMREVLKDEDDGIALEFRAAMPGEPGSAGLPFAADDGYIVKPAFGMSSSDVKYFSKWEEAAHYAESPTNSKDWVPESVMKIVFGTAVRSNMRIIEPNVEGTEFSIDGWIRGSELHAIVQHKLCVFRSSFIGDGPTVSPPLTRIRRSREWTRLRASEQTLREFARKVLSAIGLTRGVFHMEARERYSDARLCLIEVNPRAPGGSLWRSALSRTGYDLELIDACIQLGKPVPPRVPDRHPCVLHYPFYAAKPGTLRDWGDLANLDACGISGLTVDFAVELGHCFRERDLLEEPYLAFAVAHDETREGLLAKCEAILGLTPPRID